MRVSKYLLFFAFILSICFAGTDDYYQQDTGATGGGASTFFEADWGTNNPDTDDETCSSVSGCPGIWDNIGTDADVSVTAGDKFRIAVTADQTNDYVSIDNAASDILDGFSATEWWVEWKWEIDDITAPEENDFVHYLVAYTIDSTSTALIQWNVSADQLDGFNYVRGWNDAGALDLCTDEAWVPASATQYTMRLHYKKDTDGGADVGGDDGAWEFTIVGASLSCSNTAVDNDEDSALASFKMGYTAIRHDGTNDYNVDIDDFKFYTSDPGW